MSLIPSDSRDAISFRQLQRPRKASRAKTQLGARTASIMSSLSPVLSLSCSLSLSRFFVLLLPCSFTSLSLSFPFFPPKYISSLYLHLFIYLYYFFLLCIIVTILALEKTSSKAPNKRHSIIYSPLPLFLSTLPVSLFLFLTLRLSSSLEMIFLLEKKISDCNDRN